MFQSLKSGTRVADEDGRGAFGAGGTFGSEVRRRITEGILVQESRLHQK
jgi:hypothetical protein